MTRVRSPRNGLVVDLPNDTPAPNCPAVFCKRPTPGDGPDPDALAYECLEGNLTATIDETTEVQQIATGGTPPYTWSTSPDLPNGVAYQPGTGLLIFTPTAASGTQAEFTFIVTDDAGATAQCDITVDFVA